ncbi:MAG: DUF2339 domain-containing protein, partial [Blastocatellia bacterium]
MEHPSSDDDRLKQILERLDYLDVTLHEQVRRIYSLERLAGVAPPPVAPLPSEVPAPQPAVEIVSTTSAVVEARMERNEITDAPVKLPKGNAAAVKSPTDFEALIAGSWFNRIGIVAIILGVGYFLREAFRRGWIGPHGRVLTGVALGVGLLLAGERLRGRGYRNYAQSLSGGGIAILYLAFFAAFARYGLIGQLPAFALMTMVTATSVLLAARTDALPIAILGLIGGFLTPVMLSTGVDNQTGLFTYIALLDLGVLAVAYFNQWRVLNYLAFGLTVMMSALWLNEWYEPSKLWKTIFFFTLLFLIFAALAIFHNVIHRRMTRFLDLALVFANATLYFATAYSLLEPQYHGTLGLFALLMAAFYFGFGYLVYTRDREDRYLILTCLGLATNFVTVSAPIQFDQYWVTMAWAIEGAVLMWIGVKTPSRVTRAAALIVFAIGVIHWFSIDFAEAGYNGLHTFAPIFNKRAASALALIAAMAVATRLLRAESEDVKADEREAFLSALILGANGLAVVWLTADLQDYFRQARARLDAGSPAEMERRLYNNREFTQTLLLSVYGSAAMIFGILRNLRVLRAGAALLLGVAALKLLFVDSRYNSETWHTLIFNQTFLGFVLFAAALAICARFYARARVIEDWERKAALAVLVASANLFALAGLSFEAYGHFEAALPIGEVTDWEAYRETRLAQQLSLSILWAIYGGALLAAGIRRGARFVRVMGLGLLGLTIAKVFFGDLASLDRIYRILSFIVLGAILLAVSFYYQRTQRQRDAVRGA